MIFSHFLEWLWGDYMLYNHFKGEFLKKREAFGLERLKSERELLKNATEQTLKRCAGSKKDNFCQYLRLPEMKFLAKIKERQSEKSIQILTKKFSGLSGMINDTKRYFARDQD